MRCNARMALAVLVLLAIAVPAAEGATLGLKARVPTYDNDGTCAAPVLLSRSATDLAWVHFRWTGPVSGEDSVQATSGTLVLFSRPAPPGLYTVRAWASDSGGVGCDTTITLRVKVAPWKVAL